LGTTEKEGVGVGALWNKPGLADISFFRFFFRSEIGEVVGGGRFVSQERGGKHYSTSTRELIEGAYSTKLIRHLTSVEQLVTAANSAERCCQLGIVRH
jgi:hypothetical protein